MRKYGTASVPVDASRSRRCLQRIRHRQLAHEIRFAESPVDKRCLQKLRRDHAQTVVHQPVLLSWRMRINKGETRFAALPAFELLCIAVQGSARSRL